MRISEVSRLTGASAKAIRLYEARGLLPPVPRLNRYRDYSEQDVAWVQLIRQALALGITLAAVSRLQGRDGRLDWPAVLALLEQQRSRIASERARLAQVGSTCSRSATNCGSGCTPAMVTAPCNPAAAPWRLTLPLGHSPTSRTFHCPRLPCPVPS